jgi:hypothetical protein
MKRLPILLLLLIFSVPAFAQFPLGSDMPKIKTYFAKNVPYASFQEFKTEDGDVICFTKARVIGDYTFYFGSNGLCTSYVVTYDKQELSDLIKRFDGKFCRLLPTKWESADETFDVTLLQPKPGDNYFSILYKPLPTNNYQPNSLASN